MWTMLMTKYVLSDSFDSLKEINEGARKVGLVVEWGLQTLHKGVCGKARPDINEC